jgi:hypothetical protein
MRSPLPTPPIDGHRVPSPIFPEGILLQLTKEFFLTGFAKPGERHLLPPAAPANDEGPLGPRRGRLQ